MEAAPLLNRSPSKGEARKRSDSGVISSSATPSPRQPITVDTLQLPPHALDFSARRPAALSCSAPSDRAQDSWAGANSQLGDGLGGPGSYPCLPRRSRSGETEGSGSAPDAPLGGRNAPDAPVDPISFWSYFSHQLLVGVDETVTAEMEDESSRRRRKGVYHFLQAPWELEKLLLVGYLVCLDSFLFMVTMLPLRVARSSLSLLVRRRISWLQVCDMMCVGAILIAVAALGQIDTSQAYHSVKGQAVIKLYVVFNVLEVFDKLCASFGQDILHTLFWSSMARRTWRGHLLLDFTIVAVYLVVHSCVLFYQVVSLNVAVNSHNNVMLTLLVSNNFVELKSNVFKRFEPENLFVLACNDIVERFQLTCYLLIVSLHVLTVHADSVVMGNVLGAVAMVSAAELLVDWIKHAFVIKFNGIQPVVYRRFHAVLCRDLANSVAGQHEDRQAGPHMLQSGAAASTRIGFSCIPLLCLVLRSVSQFVRWLELTKSITGIAILLLAWAFLFLLKALLSVGLTGYACEQTLLHAQPRPSTPGLQSTVSFDNSTSPRASAQSVQPVQLSASLPDSLQALSSDIHADASTSPADFTPMRFSGDRATDSARRDENSLLTHRRNGGGGGSLTTCCSIRPGCRRGVS
mmetsp:Transcript_23636/g.59013  ORF Transcript_23636/g.59013 Transcript_23636/m.59013 type:complete len:632 (+) Transcript_23636:48-1943(+)